MELKIKEVNPVEEKSVQEVEEKLLKKHEEENKEPEKVQETSAEVAEEPKVEEPTAEQNTEPVSEVESPTIKDEDVLSYIKNRYNKDISSVDDLFTQKEQNEPLPEDVSKYLDFKRIQEEDLKIL